MNDLLYLLAQLALFIPLIVLVVLGVAVGNRAADFRAWALACVGVSLVPLVLLGLATVFPAFNPTSPDVFLDDFFFSAQLVIGGVGGLSVVGLFTLFVAVRGLVQRRKTRLA